ncbi:MAG: TerB family tellurite resistance protein [Alphaproteobacteria bacterium]|nr:TerB family tellurite resistance protein [Alphaproteobacteria bacterium]
MSGLTSNLFTLIYVSPKIYALFEGQQEPLEHIIIGLIQIAAADGVITNQERQIIENVCRVFQFPRLQTQLAQ